MFVRHRLIVLTAVVVLLTTACGEGGGPVATVSPTQTTPVPSSAVRFEVWFGYGEFLFVTQRTRTPTWHLGTAAVTALLAGPSAQERAAGVGTLIPEGTGLLGLSITGGVATVNLTRSYESGGGSLLMFGRLAQLTYTLTQFGAVRGVNLKLDGRPVRVFSGEGIILDRPMTRRSFRDQLPPILVRSPSIGQQVSSPIRISGTAEVFEAVVSITILDAQGREIVSTTAPAACSTGCRGAFAKAVAYRVDRTQLGTVRVYESSPRNGEPINVVDIPVVLTA